MIINHNFCIKLVPLVIFIINLISGKHYKLNCGVREIILRKGLESMTKCHSLYKKLYPNLQNNTDVKD